MVLVTGATGLVGAHLLLHLSQNETTIRAIYRNPKNIEKTKSLFQLYDKSNLFATIEWIQADILDIPTLEIAFQNIDYVYHCAACISFNPSDENQLRNVNIQGTANIVNFCIDKKVQKLCHVSSIAALGDLAPHEKIITETTEWNPEKLHSDYAISKYGAEMEVWRGQQEGLQVVIVNPGVIFGAGFWNQGSGAFFTSVQKGFPFYTKGTSGYVSVTDVVKIMQQLMQSDIRGERFILISENKSYKEIIYTIADKINAKKPTIEAKPWLLNIAWRMDWFLSKIIRTERKISKYAAQSLQNTDEISNKKITTTLDYSFQTIEEALNEVVVFFKKSI
jgi:nucleoside-diphosphate-sugar epimerase